LMPMQPVLKPNRFERSASNYDIVRHAHVHKRNFRRFQL
jgi:hypothetical protein